MILITGAAGFIGTAVVSEFARQGMPFRPIVRKPQIGYLAIGDISPTTDWIAALDGVDAVVHLASRTHLMNETTSDSQAQFQTFVALSLHLARQAAAAGVRRFVFISSIKVNGDATRPGHPFTADDVPSAQNLYARTKLEVEQGLFDLSRNSGMEVTVIRPPLVYGPGVKGNFATLLNCVNRGVPLPLGSVDNKRSFVFVGNLAHLIVLATSHPNAAGQVFLVSDDHDMSTTELLREAASALGRRSRIMSVPTPFLTFAGAALRRRDITSRLIDSLQIDVAKTRELLGWLPRKSVTEGLLETARWFQDVNCPLDLVARSA